MNHVLVRSSGALKGLQTFSQTVACQEIVFHCTFRASLLTLLPIFAALQKKKNQNKTILL